MRQRGFDLTPPNRREAPALWLADKLGKLIFIGLPVGVIALVGLFAALNVFFWIVNAVFGHT